MISDEPRGRCGHLFTHAQRSPSRARKFGLVWVEAIDCADCEEKAIVRLYSDERDEPRRPLDGIRPVQRKEYPA